jgi:hypothetical protein
VAKDGDAQLRSMMPLEGVNDVVDAAGWDLEERRWKVEGEGGG